MSGMQFDFLVLVYALPMVGIWIFLGHSGRKEEQRSVQAKAEAHEAGLHEPATLHPVIDPAACMGCGACVRACPEGEILGLIGGKAHLIEPSHCIGHGACRAACPFDAISLVFGTATRGVDLPVVGPDFQTNVPGLYIAGELGGMGLIRNAIEQGRQAMNSIAASKVTGKGGDVLDVVIVGAGPAGFSASLRAKELGLSFVTLEQETLGGTVAHFPRGKLVMTEPANLPLVGLVKFRETSKESLLEFWRGVQQRTGLKINFQERVEDLKPNDGSGFDVRTSRQTYQARTVVLAIGRRGTPRMLGVPGEDLSKVVYRMIDPEQYAGRNLLVVGGGDSAVEAATTVADLGSAGVTLSYRGEAIARCRPKNRARLEALVQEGRIRLMLNSNVSAIQQHAVHILQGGQTFKIANDDVVICAGGVLPSDFLREIGIEIETKHGTA